LLRGVGYYSGEFFLYKPRYWLTSCSEWTYKH
jgi:hypothetical protein